MLKLSVKFDETAQQQDWWPSIQFVDKDVVVYTPICVFVLKIFLQESLKAQENSRISIKNLNWYVQSSSNNDSKF